MSKQLWWKLPHNHMISVTAGFYLGNNTQVTPHQYRQCTETDQEERKLKLRRTFSPISQRTHRAAARPHTEERRAWDLTTEAFSGGAKKPGDLAWSLLPKYMLMGQWLPGCVCARVFLLLRFAYPADVLQTCTCSPNLRFGEFHHTPKLFYLQANWSILKGWKLTGEQYNRAANAEEFGC